MVVLGLLIMERQPSVSVDRRKRDDPATARRATATTGR
jgi:hypothetical protein